MPVGHSDISWPLPTDRQEAWCIKLYGYGLRDWTVECKMRQRYHRPFGMKFYKKCKRLANARRV